MENKNIVTCGIDASLNKTGISCFINGIYNQHTLIDLRKEKNSEKKYKNMCQAIISTLEKMKPDIIIIERMHTIRQIDVFRKFCKLAGMIEKYSWDNECFYVEMSPSEWRAGVKEKDERLPRKREELKIWSVNTVKKLFNIEVSADDEADSILIAQGYINKFKGLKGE